MPIYPGQCYCGAIKFYCDADPFFTQYCHCNKCREIASSSHLEKDKCGYAYTAGYLAANLHLSSGIDQLDAVIRNNAKLFLCKSCHSFIYGISLDVAKQAGIGINANNFQLPTTIPDSFKPVRHVWYAERIIDFDDDLPKFKDTPKEQFGSGELCD